MIEEIIINGVNVAGCEYCFKRDNTVCCSDYITGLCEDYNCHYKQLKRLEQENKELKNKNICRETCEYFKRICNENTLLIKYRSVLEEIRDILKHRPYLSNGDVEHIVRRIDEVLNENTEN